MNNLKQEIKDLETEYRLQKKYLEADGVLDDNDKQQLQSMLTIINQVKAQLKKQEEANAQKDKPSTETPKDKAPQTQPEREQTNSSPAPETTVPEQEREQTNSSPVLETTAPEQEREQTNEVPETSVSSVENNDQSLVASLEQIHAQIKNYSGDLDAWKNRVFQGMSLDPDQENCAISMDAAINSFYNQFNQLSSEAQLENGGMRTDVDPIKQKFSPIYTEHKKLKAAENKSSGIGVSVDGVYEEQSLSKGVTISEDEVNLSTGGFENSHGETITGSIKATKDGDVEGTVGVENRDGVQGSVTVGNNKFAVMLGKKWNLGKFEQQLPFALGPVPCFVGVRLSAALTIQGNVSVEGQRDENREVVDAVSKISVTTSLTGTVNFDVGIKPAIVEAGLTLEGSVVGYIKGEASANSQDFGYNLHGGIDINAGVGLFIRASKEIRELAEKTTDIKEDDLSINVKLGQINKIFVFTGIKVTKPIGGEQHVVWGEFALGPGYYQIEAKFKEYYNSIVGVAGKVKELVGDASDYWSEKGVIGGLQEFGSELSDFIGDQFED
ncbi:MAG: hypothetical protein MK212_21175 [Saprospiraceae bacterium]|nr:hypothetical protein [Saprospiraceae bacterium]